MTINNLKEFLSWRGFGEDEARYWARCFYKYVDCGPWAVFLMRDVEAWTEEHEPLVAKFRNRDGQAVLENPEELDEKFVSFLGFDENGLSKKERGWEEYIGLVEKFIEDEKSSSHARDVEILHKSGSVLHLKRPGFGVDHPETYREIYYEDIGPKYAWVESKCGCRLKPIGPHPDDPQEEMYKEGDFDPECEACQGSGIRRDWRPTGEVVTVDPEECLGIKFGSIVEGSEVCSGPFTHIFPFETEDFERDEDYMEKETSFYWERDNGSWYCVVSPDEAEEWHVVDAWGDLRWKDEEPPEPIKEAAIKAIKNDWQDDPDGIGIRQTIPELSLWYRKQNPSFEPMPLGDTGASIYTYTNDDVF